MKNLPLSLTVSAATGALTLLRPADWSSRTRRWYVFGPGALGSAVMAVGLVRGFRKLEAGDQANDGGAVNRGDGGPGGEGTEGRPIRRMAAGAVLVAATGLAMAGAQAVSLKADAAVERWLADRGVAKPRRWMAATVALASMAADVVYDRSDP